jgi:hypothetical protein
VGDEIASVVSIVAAAVGLAFAILAFVFFVGERREATTLRSDTKTRIDALFQRTADESRGPGEGVAEGVSRSIGEDAKVLAELAKALKDLSRSLQAAFIAVLFFLIAAGGGIGVAATDAAQTAADNGPDTTTICTQGCQAGG